MKPQNAAPPSLSFVLPLRDESNNLDPLYRDLSAVLAEIGCDYELIFIDDGSTDGSFAILERLHAADPHVRALQLRAPFGKGAAYAAGFSAARNDVVVTLDTDQQDDPRDLPAFLERIDAGFDLVVGWKTDGKGTRGRSFASGVFNRVVARTTGVALHDVNCPFRAMRREVAQEVEIHGDLFRFLPVLAAARGFRIAEIPIANRPRGHGRTKFGPGRYYRGLLDLMTVLVLTRFGKRPLHFIGLGGLLGFLGGFGVLAFLLVAHLLHNLDIITDHSWELHQRPLLSLGLLLMILGGQTFSLGLLAELVVARGGRRDARPDVPLRRSLPERPARPGSPEGAGERSR